MLKLTLGGVKGGISKTTVAIHVCGYFHQQGKRVLLVDADPRNRSAVLWAQSQQALPFTVVDDRLLLKVAEGKQFDVVAFDTAGSADAKDLEVLADGCDLMILPTSPDAPSMASLIRTIKLLKEMPRVKYKVVITRTPPPRMIGEMSPEEVDARAILAELGVPVFAQSLPERKVFRQAASQGTLVSAMKGESAKHAWLCCEALGKEIEDETQKR